MVAEFTQGRGKRPMREVMSSSSEQSSIEAQAEAWKELALLTLEAVATHAVKCGEEDGAASFSTQVREMAEGLREAPDTAQILVAAGSVAQRFASYNAQVQQSILALSESVARGAEAGARPGSAETTGTSREVTPAPEPQALSEASASAIAGTLVTSVATHLAEWGQDPANPASLEALQPKLEKIVAGAIRSNIEGALSAGLKDLLGNVETTFKKNHQMVVMLQDRVSGLKVLPSGSGRSLPAASDGRPMDSCTGLPLRAEAESMVRHALENHVAAHLVVFYLHRMQLTNARFGSSVGDQVIFYCSQKIATDLITGANDQLFRWTGPAFVALVGHLESEADVRSEVQRLVSSPLSRYFETATRSVFLPVKLSADVYPLHDTTTEALIEKLELFLLNSSGAAHS
jgi:GGDEF domain-containing protein